MCVTFSPPPCPPPSPPNGNTKIFFFAKTIENNISGFTKNQLAKSEEFSVFGRGYLGPASGWPPPGRNPGYMPAVTLKGKLKGAKHINPLVRGSHRRTCPPSCGDAFEQTSASWWMNTMQACHTSIFQKNRKRAAFCRFAYPHCMVLW